MKEKIEALYKLSELGMIEEDYYSISIHLNNYIHLQGKATEPLLRKLSDFSAQISYDAQSRYIRGYFYFEETRVEITLSLPKE